MGLVSRRRLIVSAVTIGCAWLLAACVNIGDPSTPGVTDKVQTAGLQGGASATSGRELWLIPSPQDGLLMRAYVYRPAGNGPFPLAVVNHGSDQDRLQRARTGMPSFPAITNWLLARGYAVVLPQRPGHGETGGRYLEDQGRCTKADYTGSGRATADSIDAAIKFMTAQDFIRPAGVVVVGNSAGAWGALALASRNPADIRAVINFSGGRGGRNRGRADSNCSPTRLVAAAGAFGRTARIPTLWLYSENDSFFPPDLSRRMSDAYRNAGGTMEYHLLPPVAGEGHLLIQTSGSNAAWQPIVARFLDEH